MSIKTKTLTAAALTALAVPGAALADGSAKSHGKSSEAKSHQKPKGKAFTVKGVDFGGATLNSDSELTGPITLDPTSANKHARKALELTKTELRGEDTVTFGEADDKVIVKYVGLQSTDALLPTDKVKVIGKVTRSGKLDLRKITVTRETETQS